MRKFSEFVNEQAVKHNIEPKNETYNTLDELIQSLNQFYFRKVFGGRNIFNQSSYGYSFKVLKQDDVTLWCKISRQLWSPNGYMSGDPIIKEVQIKIKDLEKIKNSKQLKEYFIETLNLK